MKHKIHKVMKTEKPHAITSSIYLLFVGNKNEIAKKQIARNINIRIKTDID